MTNFKTILRTAIAGALAIGGTSAAVAGVDRSTSAEPRTGSIVRLGDAADVKAQGERLMQVAGNSSSNSSSNSSNNSSSNSNSNSSSNSNSNSSSNSNSNSSDDDDGDDD